MIEQGYCEKVEFSGGPGRTWYLPHHGVYHPEKPGKIRVVFDCSAKFNGVSINDNLLQGPDLTNSLVGVLLRFRREEVAIQADIKSMFYQVRIPAKDIDLLRFIWWKNANVDEDRRDGVLVRASASQSVDLGFIPLVESYQKTLKKWYPQLPCLALGI